jgi:phage gpG-like protein
VKPTEPSIEVRGATKAAVDLHQLGERGSDIRRVSEKVRSVYRKSNERRFASDGAGSWAPLDQATKDWKSRRNIDPRPLRGATGALYRSLTSPRAANQIDRRDKTEFRFGTTVPYAGYHAFGKGSMHRDPLELNAAERDEITRLISAYVAKAQT